MSIPSNALQSQQSARSISRRRMVARVWSYIFGLSIGVAILALAALLFTLFNQSLSWVIVNERGRAEETYTFTEGLFNRAAIDARAAEEEGTVQFHNWLNPTLLTQLPSSRNPLVSGMLPSIISTVLVVALTTLIAFPIGVAAAIYLEEYADSKKWYNRMIQVNIANLSGVPSIIYGLLGLTIFVRLLGGLTQGRTVLSGSLTMALLVLPIIIISAQEAIRAVPQSLRQASYGLGATKWQTIWHHVLPNAFGGILTGTILAVSRAAGETAPLIVVGVGTVLFVPNGVFSRFSAIPYQVYNWTTLPQAGYTNLAAAGSLVLLALVLAANGIAIYLRNRFRRKI